MICIHELKIFKTSDKPEESLILNDVTDDGLSHMFIHSR